jgi:DNA-binding MarR family transcriptional regulator
MHQNDAIDRFIAEWSQAKPGLDVHYLATLGRIIRISTHLRDTVDDWLQEFGLTWDIFDLLVSLQKSGSANGLRPTDLYESCLLSSGAITNRIDRAEKLGLAIRRPDPDDGRATRIALTKRGQKVAERAMKEHSFRARQIADCLNPAEHEMLSGLLRKVLRTLEASKEAPNSGKRKPVADDRISPGA